MKRLIRKANFEPEMYDEFKFSEEDPNYKDKSLNDIALPGGRDAAILVDTKDRKIIWGLNGEYHADLLEKYYDIPQDSNDTYLSTDSYVSPGVYLKNYLGKESFIMYSTLPDTVEVIHSEKPDAYVFEDQYNGGEIMRIGKKE